MDIPKHIQSLKDFPWKVHKSFTSEAIFSFPNTQLRPLQGISKAIKYIYRYIWQLYTFDKVKEDKWLELRQDTNMIYWEL